MDRSQVKKWLTSPGKMANKYSLHVVYFCTGCGIIEIPPVITSRWDAERFGVKPVASPRHGNLLTELNNPGIQEWCLVDD